MIDGELNRNGPDTTSQAMGYDEAGELCWVYSSTVSSPSCSSPPSGSTSYSFDADGERSTVVPSSGNSQAYGWNAANELRCANTNGSTCSIASPTSTTTLYTYDGTGLRTSSTISSTTTSYTWDSTTALPRLVVSGSTSYLYGYGSAPVVQISGTASDLLLADPIGSVHGLVQLSSGSLQDLLVNYTDYDAYGVPGNTGGLTQGHTSINANWSVTSAIGYAGSYEDPSGLVYVQQRYYDPQSGQFTSVDPELKQTRQPYEYGGNDPLSNVDLTGQSLWGTRERTLYGQNSKDRADVLLSVSQINAPVSSNGFAGYITVQTDPSSTSNVYQATIPRQNLWARPYTTNPPSGPWTLAATELNQTKIAQSRQAILIFKTSWYGPNPEVFTALYGGATFLYVSFQNGDYGILPGADLASWTIYVEYGGVVGVQYLPSSA